MTLVPAKCLSNADIALLGNNLLPHVLRDRRHEPLDEPPMRRTNRPFSALPAVNRSLAMHGESVATLTSAGGNGGRGRKSAICAASD